MHTRRRFALSIALVASLTAAAAAHAGTLITHPVVLESDQTLLCILANEGKKAVRNVVVEVARYDIPPPATVAATSDIAELMPLQYVVSSFTPDGADMFLCRFKFPGSGKWLRGSGVVRDTASGDLQDTQPAR